MSDNNSFVSTVEFDLPAGYTDDQGQTHKRVTMRCILNGDIIAYFNDQEMKELAGSKYRLDGSNPAEMMMATAVAHKMDNIMYARTILKFGDIPKEQISRRFFEKLFESDIKVIQQHYLELNGFTKAAKGDGDTPPFEQ